LTPVPLWSSSNSPNPSKPTSFFFPPSGCSRNYVEYRNIRVEVQVQVQVQVQVHEKTMA
jgi:hypothetical protein